MRVSAPIAVLTAQQYAARHGILIRSGRALEMLAQVDAIVFDKTATLTQGHADVIDIEMHHSGMGAAQLLALAASAEQELDHPVAHAITRRAQQLETAVQKCSAWEYVSGLGVTATIDAQVVHVGSLRMMQELGMGDDAERMQNTVQSMATHVYVARDGVLLGRLHCADPIRAEGAAVIARLHHMGITSLLLSGDSQSVSRAVAVDLGIAPNHVYAEILPQRKVDVVQSLQARGQTVAVVGDGVNDVAAMAHADVGIALGNATDLARETADIVLLDNDLRDLVATTEIARHAMQVIRQNRALVVVPNVGAIAYGALFVLNPIAGVVINNGAALAAALNSLRPLRGPSKVVQP
jgi:Cu2+-exporting ATPase